MSHLLPALEKGCGLKVSDHRGSHHHNVILLRADNPLLLQVENFDAATEVGLEVGYSLLTAKKNLACAIRNHLTPEEVENSPLRSIILMHEPFVFKGGKKGRYMVGLDGDQLKVVQFVETITPLPVNDEEIGLIFSF